MFEDLSQKLEGAFKKLRGRGVLTPENIKEGLREVRRALLEADVNFKVAKDFIKRVEEKASGQEVLKGLNPGQQVVKIVHEELVGLLGGELVPLAKADSPPTVLMVVGLQGAGKTTLCGKLAQRIKKSGRRVLLVAADVYRPAAMDQLKVVGEGVGVEVFIQRIDDAVKICRAGVEEANNRGFDVVILDTAGRLHIDDELMGELQQIESDVKPHETLLVVDGLTGQDAVNVAESFNEKLGLTGAVLTKMDGDARGGAALSMRHVTGVPIKFVGVGEKSDALEEFHPDRMASRILGMGDVLTLVEKAQEVVDQDEAMKMAEKLRKQQFSLEDFLTQMQQIKKMGPLEDILKMIPGVGNKLSGMSIDDKAMGRIEAIIQSMTRGERETPTIINGSRRKRIARGSGTSIQEVNQLLKQFRDAQKMMKMLGKRGGKGMKLPLPF
ncbi:MAG: signal recognition particle protein [Candidatus Eisenbacteria bacterium]|uniref:Signal recognition particle protein n=1 Tax=Eiseniibacteriota bacterium TaxID=2212470 RepID=A0A7Y2H297_UNCEI|nr:signal recognition particle protein [Candidatus Eisenbacteria bacterium]